MVVFAEVDQLALHEVPHYVRWQKYDAPVEVQAAATRAGGPPVLQIPHADPRRRCAHTLLQQAQVKMDPVLRPRQYDSPVHYCGSARPGHPLSEGIPAAARFAFLGGFVDCRPNSGGVVVADIHAPDQARLEAREFNRCGAFPAEARWPLAIARDTGQGRTVYIAAQAESESRRAHAPELDSLIVASVLWAGGTPPPETPDCPHTVEVRPLHDAERRRFQVILVNQTTNRLGRAANNGVVRYVTPQKGLRLALNAELTVASVSSVAGSDVRCSSESGKVILDVPVLDLYDSVLVEYD